MPRYAAMIILGLGLVGCSRSNQAGGGGGGDASVAPDLSANYPLSFDPCAAHPSAGFDPKARMLPSCCKIGDAHCLAASVVPPRLGRGLAPCTTADGDSGGLCLPDRAIQAGASYMPRVCSSFAMQPGVCLSLCIPLLAKNPQVGLLPQDVCDQDEKCVPCINPFTMMPTGACDIVPKTCDGGIGGIGDGGGSDDGGGDGGGGNCPYTGPPLLDPSTLGPCSPACAGAHCILAALVPAAQQSLLSACTINGTPGFCAPDPVIAAGGNYVPPTCTSIAGAEGRCLSTCLPAVAAQSAQLPQDLCPTGTKCAPCFNPVAADPTAPTGACTTACDQPAHPPLLITCPWNGPPLTDPNSFPQCNPMCNGAHCVPAANVPKAEQAVLAPCNGGFCTPDPFIRTGGNFIPKSCSSLLGVEGRCLSTCLPSVAAQSAQLPQDACTAAERCAPCYNPAALDPTKPTGACSVGCDKPGKPPLILSCPYNGPDVVDPRTFPDCNPICAGAHCVPAANVPMAEQALLSPCNGGFCTPDSFIRTAGNYVPPACTSIAGAEGRCLSTCLPSIAAQAAQLPQDVCPMGSRCAPCFNPTAADPLAPTGACGVACDMPTQPPVILSCPWNGPDVVDPASFPDCNPACGGAHCVPAANVPAAQQALLAPCNGGFCSPDPFIRTAGNYVPPPCAPIAGTPAEGRCLSTCLPSIQAQAAQLSQGVCAAGELCTPCYDPFTGNATGACSVACDAPAQPAYTFPTCCPGATGVDAATCIPSSRVPAGQAANLQQLTCPATLLCVPDEYLPNALSGPATCTTPLNGRGACVSKCVNIPFSFLFFQQTCPDNHLCVSCLLAPQTPGC